MTSQSMRLIVRLEDGTEVSSTFTELIFNNLVAFASEFPSAMLELVRKCRDESHVLDERTLGQIASKHFIQYSGCFYPEIKSLVLEMTSGQEGTFTPVFPGTIIIPVAA